MIRTTRTANLKSVIASRTELSLEEDLKKGTKYDPLRYEISLTCSLQVVKGNPIGAHRRITFE